MSYPVIITWKRTYSDNHLEKARKMDPNLGLSASAMFLIRIVALTRALSWKSCTSDSGIHYQVRTVFNWKLRRALVRLAIALILPPEQLLDEGTTELRRSIVLQIRESGIRYLKLKW